MIRTDRRRLLLALLALLFGFGVLAGCGDDDDSGRDDDDAADADDRDDNDGNGDDGDASPDIAFGTVTVTGDTLGSDPVGAKAPAVTSTTREAGEVAIDPADGTPRVMVFLAHWCPHCQAEVPVLVDAAEDGVFEGVELVAVLTGTNPDAPNFPPSAWLDDEDWPGVRFYDDEDATVGLSYGLDGFPLIVFVDGDGVVQERVTGEQPVDVIEDGVAAIR